MNKSTGFWNSAMVEKGDCHQCEIQWEPYQRNVTKAVEVRKKPQANNRGPSKSGESFTDPFMLIS